MVKYINTLWYEKTELYTNEEKNAHLGQGPLEHGDPVNLQRISL